MQKDFFVSCVVLLGIISAGFGSCLTTRKSGSVTIILKILLITAIILILRHGTGRSKK